MKEIKAIIDPSFIYQVMEALHALRRFPGVTISDAQGQGRGEGEGGKYISYGDPLSFKKKIKLELFCSDEECDEYVEVILKASHSATSGKGIIQVTPLDRVVRISSGQRDDEAV
jgi:nitrogen regulatory protein P-II 1